MNSESKQWSERKPGHKSRMLVYWAVSQSVPGRFCVQTTESMCGLCTHAFQSTFRGEAGSGWNVFRSSTGVGPLGLNFLEIHFNATVYKSEFCALNLWLESPMWLIFCHLTTKNIYSDSKCFIWIFIKITDSYGRSSAALTSDFEPALPLFYLWTCQFPSSEHPVSWRTPSCQHCKRVQSRLPPCSSA